MYPAPCTAGLRVWTRNLSGVCVRYLFPAPGGRLPTRTLSTAPLLSGVSNIEPSSLHVQEKLLFTQSFGEKLFLVKDNLLPFA